MECSKENTEGLILDKIIQILRITEPVSWQQRSVTKVSFVNGLEIFE